MKRWPTPDPNACDAPVLRANGLVKQFAGRRVVDGVDLCCRASEVLGLLGANGAGKTTTLRLCAGFLRPDAGTIRVAGIDRRADPEAAARRVGVCTQDDTFDRDFTVRGNLEPMSRYFRPRPPSRREPPGSGCSSTTPPCRRSCYTPIRWWWCGTTKARRRNRRKPIPLTTGKSRASVSCGATAPTGGPRSGARTWRN